MNGSRSRFVTAVFCVGLLALTAGACSKKDNTTSTGSGSGTTAAPAASSTTAAKGTGTTAKGAKPNPCGDWPTAARGAPEASKKPDTQGFFVWQDVSGWHVRARGTASKEPFKGTVRGSRDLGSVKENPVGSGVKADLKGNVVTFEIPASGDLKGFDLQAGCNVDQLQFALLIGPNPAPADAIFVGANGKALGPVFVEQKS